MTALATNTPSSASSLPPEKMDWPGVTPPQKPFPVPQFLHHFVQNPLRCLPQSVYEEPIVPYQKGRLKIVWLTDPDLVEKVFLEEHKSFPKPPLEQRVFSSPLGKSILTDQGDEWRWQRYAVSGLFRHQNLLTYVPTMSQAAENLLARWRKGGQSAVRPIHKDITQTTYEAISRTLFGGMAMPEAGTIQAAVDMYLNNTPWEIVATLVGLPDWAWHPGRPRLKQASKQMRASIERLLDRWMAVGDKDGPHLLSHLLQAEEPGQNGKISRTRILNNLLTFLNAGHETTGKALIWALYVAARQPLWQQKVREEVERVAGSDPITGDHISQLVLTRQMFEESMRLYAPAPVLTRVAMAPCQLGPVKVEKGTLVFLPIWAVHRHKKLWRDPDQFDPTRFTPENKKKMCRSQYLPFGFGPRICIGASFATIEGVTMFATLLRAAQFDWDGQLAPEPMSKVTLWPRGGMPLKVTLFQE